MWRAYSELVPFRRFRKAVQQGRSNAKSLRYVESVSDARTPLAAFLNGLLGFLPALLLG